MITTFDNATLKVWFKTLGTCRVFNNVIELEHRDNLMIIKRSEEKSHTVLINFSNITMIEES
jgi:hypothetical protein